MFIDNDDFFKKNMCLTMYKTIVKEDVDIVSCRPLVSYDNEKYKIDRTFLDKEKEFVKIDSIKEHPKIMSSGATMLIWNKIFKRELLINHNIRFPNGCLYEDVNFMSQAYLNAKGIVMLNDFWGYEYVIRTKGEKSTSQDYNKKNLIKQLKGLKEIVKILEDYNADYPALECEMLVDGQKFSYLPH